MKMRLKNQGIMLIEGLLIQQLPFIKLSHLNVRQQKTTLRSGKFFCGIVHTINQIKYTYIFPPLVLPD
jgi:hypothetical protein